jgi:dolichol-phosphate mannosyltransferase
MAPEISVVVPLRNESANVRPLEQRVFRAFHSMPGGIELLLVDDASADDTWQQVLEVERGNPGVRAFRLLRHQGQSAALWTGFRSSRGPILATLDGDLQNDPADLPSMLEYLAGCDMVCGVRAKRADNAVRRLSSRLARMAVRLTLRIDFADPGCNQRVFRRAILDAIPAFDGMHRFMPFLARNAGALVKEFPVPHYSRIAGRSKYGVWNRLGPGLLDLVMVRWYLKRQIRMPGLEPPSNRHSREEPARRKDSNNLSNSGLLQ